MATPSRSVDDAAPPREAPRLASRASVATGLLALAIVMGLAAFSGASAALHRPLWLDEIVTQLVAQAPHGILHAMRSGVDFQPPPHYVLVRLADALAGAASPFSARLPSVIAALLTVLLLGATLRTRLSFASALAGALALAAHPLFIGQAVEARPYALWIFAAALTAECLRAERRGAIWLAGAAAMALCTSHYFGVLTLGAMALAVAGYSRFARQLSWNVTMRSVAPLAAGVVTLIALLPLARTQLAATAGRSWVSPATAGDIAFFLQFIWGWHPALLLITAGVLVLVARRIPPLAARLPRPDHVSLDITMVALLATAAVPLLVVLVTLAYKPVLVLRYAAPALLAVATLCALAVEMLPRPVRWVSVVLLARAALFSLQSTATAARAESAFFAGEMRAVRQLAAHGIPTVSPFRHDAYRASLPAAGTPAVAWMDLPDSLLERAAASGAAALTRNSLLVERDFGRAVQREFGFPEVVSAVEARGHASVALLRDATQSAADTLWFPGWSACALSSRLVVYSRPAAPPSCGAIRAAHQEGLERR
jgi:hypothetical protein